MSPLSISLLVTLISLPAVLTHPHAADANEAPRTGSARGPAAAPAGQNPPYEEDGKWVVPGVATFNHHALYTFDDKFPAELQRNMYNLEEDTPFSHGYTLDNAYLSGGFLNLRVPGGQRKSPLKCGEVQTVTEDILYASVRTDAAFPTVPGTCCGIFFFRSDNGELDIEWLSDPKSLSNDDPGKALPIHYTNQPLVPGDKPTYVKGPAPKDVTAVHQYRIDWIPGRGQYFIDGVLQKTLTENVPSEPGAWMWNNWANGDNGWSVGPPATDSIMKIKRIEMYYNLSKD